METNWWNKNLQQSSSLSPANFAAARQSVSLQLFLLFPLFLSFFLSDEGQSSRAVARTIFPAMIAWWVGLLFIIVHRPKTEKQIDRLSLRIGILPLLIMSLMAMPFWE